MNSTRENLAKRAGTQTRVMVGNLFGDNARGGEGSVTGGNQARRRREVVELSLSVIRRRTGRRLLTPPRNRVWSGEASFRYATRMAHVTIDIVPNGPFIVNGAVELKDSAGNAYPAKQRIALCRCGASTTKPFCDGTHSKVGFEAAERAVPESAEG